MIDLHVHSNCSDGTFTPEELVEYALTHDITAFALTDHDTTAGLLAATAHARALSGKVCEKNPWGNFVEVIPGIELSTEYEGKDIHVLGLFIDYENPLMKEHLSDFVSSRDNRNEKMCRLLTEYGVPITYGMLKEAFPGAVITRAHYAKFLLEKGYVKNLPEAFARYVGDQAPCFVPREKVTPMQAIQLIREAGGISVLAHPTLYHLSTARLDNLVQQLKQSGLHAIEGIYSTYSISETREIHEFARKYGLLISGGSDFHGANKPGLSFGTGYGKLYIHEEVLERLKAAL